MLTSVVLICCCTITILTVGVEQMSHNKRITENSSIIQYLMKLNFALYFTKPVIRHIVEFIIAATKKGYSGTVTDIVNLSFANCHRTTFGKFLSQGV